MRWTATLLATLLLFLAGCGATKVVTTTATTTETTTTTAVRIVHRKAPPATTTTVTDTSTTTSSAAAAAGSSGSSGAYTGNGQKNVGTITVSQPSTLLWKCQGCSTFAIGSHLDSNDSVISLDSSAGSGSTAVDPGTYSDVMVVSDGTWAFVIQPG